MTSATLPTLLDRLQTSPSAERFQPRRCRMRFLELFECLVHVGL
jgi:hypothetical protein